MECARLPLAIVHAAVFELASETQKSPPPAGFDAQSHCSNIAVHNKNAYVKRIFDCGRAPIAQEFRSDRSFLTFLQGDRTTIAVLFAATILALCLANTQWSGAYTALLGLQAGPLSLHHWVNDGLMASFFLLVGLEVKRELRTGELSTWSQRLLPGAAALGGMIMPAVIFILVNHGDRGHLVGWAIPTATDIAFALGLLSLAGPRAPASIRATLAAIAVLDDLLAILIIALVYTGHLNLTPLYGAVACLGALLLLNRSHVMRAWPYLCVGGLLWALLLASGVHATLAGVATAFAIPAERGGDRPSLLERLEHRLEPWVNLLIVPIFAFANAGLTFRALSIGTAFESLPLGILLGLFLGKQIGIFGAIWLMVRLRAAERPGGANWMHIWGMAGLCGIGFTMSLFIGGLAFPNAPDEMERVKLGVFVGSLLSGLCGLVVLGRSPARDDAF